MTLIRLRYKSIIIALQINNLNIDFMTTETYTFDIPTELDVAVNKSFNTYPKLSSKYLFIDSYFYKKVILSNNKKNVLSHA